MTLAISGKDIARQLEERFPGSVVESRQDCVVVNAGSLQAVAAFVKDTPELKCDYLNYVTAVDYFQYFEVVYQCTSIKHNHSLVIRVRCHDRDNPVIPSVVGLWQGADFQEREIYDLVGIRFEGHPNMKRIFLWEGFDGYPLRKDYL